MRTQQLQPDYTWARYQGEHRIDGLSGVIV
jgi:hypothetical protein